MARSVVVVEVNGYEIGPGADLTGANLEGADLTGAKLVHVDLHSANLIGANLSGANLIRANAEGANLEGTRANKDTWWPKGFDPEAAGVIFED